MLEHFSTKATVAKIRAIHGTMFTKDNYHEMLSRRSVADIAEYLKKTPRFKAALEDIDPTTIHRGFLESLLNKSNFDMYARLCKFQGLNKIAFFNFLIMKQEIEQILNLINDINSSLDNKYLEELPGYVIKHSKLDMMSLSKAEDFDSLLSLLKGTLYYKVLINIPPLDDGRLDFATCELKLRTFYYEKLIIQIERDFSGSEINELKKLIYSEVDIINIINAYRMKAYFGYSSAQIKSRQLPFTRIGKNRMNKYYESETPEEMIAKLEKMAYGKNYTGDYEHIETKVNSYTYHLMEHHVARSTSAPVVIYAFMKLCDMEVNNITSIIEGVRYDVDPALLEGKLLVC